MGFSGGGATFREGALIRINSVSVISIFLIFLTGIIINIKGKVLITSIFSFLYMVIESLSLIPLRIL